MHHRKRKTEVTKNQPVLKTLSAFFIWNCSNFFNMSFNLASISSSLEAISASSGANFCWSCLHVNDNCWQPTKQRQNSHIDVAKKLSLLQRDDGMYWAKKEFLPFVLCSSTNSHQFCEQVCQLLLVPRVPHLSHARWMKELYYEHVFFQNKMTEYLMVQKAAFKILCCQATLHYLEI